MTFKNYSSLHSTKAFPFGSPKKPRKPTKPLEYKKASISVTILGGTIESLLEEFAQKYRVWFPDAPDGDVLEAFWAASICGDTYYEDIEMYLYYSTAIIDPDYNRLMKLYKKKLEKYNLKLAEWKVKSEEYKVKKAEWEAEQAQKKADEERELYEQLKAKFGDA